MLKMALLECANSDNCCVVHPAHPFLSHCWLLGIWQLKCPCPQEFAIQGKKKVLMPGEVGGGGIGHSWNWLMHQYCFHLATTLKLLINVIKTPKKLSFPSTFRDAGPKCTVDNERLNESQVIIYNSKLLNTTY